MQRACVAAAPLRAFVDSRSSTAIAPSMSSSVLSSSSSWSADGTSGSDSACSTPPMHAGSILSQLERVVLAGEERNDGAGVDELPLLWHTLEQAARLQRDVAVAATGSASPPSSPPLSPHTQFIQDVTGLLFGSEYPSWMEEQWMRRGGLGDGNDDEDDDESAERGRGHASPPPVSSPSPNVTGSARDSADMGTRKQSMAVRAVVMLQRALESLQLTLPLREPAASTAAAAPSTTAGRAESAVESLAGHLLQDAPLPWLRCLLVPLCTQWTQQQQAVQQRRRVMRGSAMEDGAFADADEAGTATMQHLLDALSAAALRAALQREHAFAADILAKVRVLPLVHGTAASEQELTSARLSLCNLRVRQRRHTAELVCFAGTLARTTQSFSVLSSGAVTLITAVVTRLTGHVRASWVEWSCAHTSAEVGAVGFLCDMQHGTAKPTNITEEEEREDDQPPRQQRRVEAPAPSASVVDTLAALRFYLSAAAREHALQLWRCWILLFGFYGADLYTDAADARAMEAEAEVKAGLSRMSAPQQGQWRRLRLQARVRQHALSETHWVLCSSVVASVEAATEGCTVAAGQHCSADAPVSLYHRIVADTLTTFFMEVREALRVYGTTALAVRNGALQSAATAGPAAMQSVTHNVAALQPLFEGVVHASARAVPLSVACAGAGTLLWQLAPTLLRTQVADEAAWMGTAGGGGGGGGAAAVDYDAVGADDGEEGLHFAKVTAAHWQRIATQLEAVWTDVASLMTTVLTRAETLTAVTAAGQPPVWGCVCSDGLIHLFEELVYEGGDDAAAPVARLDDVASLFPSIFDATCFFVLQPERQRLFTRSLQQLCALVAASVAEGDASLLLSILRRDIRLWMLLTHGVLLQHERRGRLAREDEALLMSCLLPLLSVLDSSNSSRSSGGTSEEKNGAPRDDANAAVWLAWANLSTTRDLLLLLASGLLVLPWSGEEMYVTVSRHAGLSHRSTRQHAASPSASEGSAQPLLRREVTTMAAWFAVGADDITAPSARPTASAAATAAVVMWDLADGLPHASPPSSSPSSPSSPLHAGVNGGEGPAALQQLCVRLDCQTRQSRVFQRLYPPAGGAIHADVGDDVAEEGLRLLLKRHASVAHAYLCSAPCGLLMVVGAYRTLSRGLYRLRTAMAEQYQMARDDDVGELVGRSVTFCTSADVATMRTLLTVVHHIVFARTCQPQGLLRLWLGYLQHLFLCVVPHASHGDGESSGEPDTLVLMPSSWQQRHRVTTLFGARVYRTGWRALQHDGEAASHTRLREALGECLAELLLMPSRTTAIKDKDGASRSSSSFNWTSSSEDEEEKKVDPSAATAPAAEASAVLEHTLPHAVLDILCEFLAIETDNVHVAEIQPGASLRGKGIRHSFLGLAGLLAFLRRLELLVVPGGLQDPRLRAVLRCVYDAADAAALRE